MATVSTRTRAQTRAPARFGRLSVIRAGEAAAVAASRSGARRRSTRAVGARAAAVLRTSRSVTVATPVGEWSASSLREGCQLPSLFDRNAAQVYFTPPLDRPMQHLSGRSDRPEGWG